MVGLCWLGDSSAYNPKSVHKEKYDFCLRGPAVFKNYLIPKESYGSLNLSDV